MVKLIYKVLDVSPEEGPRVLLLLGVGFFMGLFSATFSVWSQTLFIDYFDAEADLPLAMVASGVLGILTTHFFGVFQARISFGKVAVSFALLFTIITAVMVGAFHLTSQDAALRPVQEQIVFWAYALQVPFVATLLLIFWGLFGRLFTLRQSKRIIGSIDTGQLMASIIALFSIPVLLAFAETAEFLLRISLGGIVFTTLFVGFIARKYALEGTAESADEDAHNKKENRISYLKMLRNPYILLMAGFMVISMMGVAFVDYGFVAVSEEKFWNQKDLANFLSIFEGTIVVFSFLFQTFITDRIIQQYGLKISLIVTPILMGGFMVISLVVGGLFIDVKGLQAYLPESELFTFFFLAIATAKLFTTSLKDALDGPAFKLYFLPLKAKIRFDVQTKIEGVVYVAAGLVAGLLLEFIGRFEVFNLMFVIFLMLPVVVIWIIITMRMHTGYRHTITETLARTKRSGGEKRRLKEYAVNRILMGELGSGNGKRVIYTLKMIERIEPGLLEDALREAQHQGMSDVDRYVQRKLELITFDEDSKDWYRPRGGLQLEEVNAVRDLAHDALRNMNTTDTLHIPSGKLIALARSRNKNDRELTAKLLSKLFSDENIFILVDLLRDIEPRVRMAALDTARRLQRPRNMAYYD